MEEVTAGISTHSRPEKNWIDTTTTIVIGTVVNIKDELAPPLKWNEGKILQIHLGKDRVTRVVTIKTIRVTVHWNRI